jgi:hypothetical protein
MSSLQDLLLSELIEPPNRIVVQQVFDFATGNPVDQVRPVERSKTPSSAKDLKEFYSLVKQVIENYEKRASVPEVNKILYTEEEPDANSKTETITFSLIKRDPGQFSQGPPFGAKHQNLRPIFREEARDPENPGYRKVITGYWYDNLVRFTCWARTNKTANERATWFEDLMEEYSWWFKLQGIDRVLFWGRDTDIVTRIDNNNWYGRPLDYFVRTEKIRVFDEKTLEEILIKLLVTNK